MRRQLASLLVKSAVIWLCCGHPIVAADSSGKTKPTWEQARIFLPGSAIPSKPATLPTIDRSLPIVLYLHGCTGFDYSHDGTMGGWAQTLTASGYAVVMPTSYAREDRPRACEQTTHTYQRELAPAIFRMRHEEIEYALDQLHNLPWVDQRNLFLMGHSEGGAAVALWAG